MQIGKLIIGCTPIGDPRDFTLRLCEWLDICDLLVVEHAEHIIPVLEKAKIRYNKNYIEYNDFASDSEIRLNLKNEAQEKIMSYLNDGKNVVLISDEGIPTINDPGIELINTAYMSGHIVDILPGASTITTSYIHSKYMDTLFDGYGFTYLEYASSAERLKKMLQGIEKSKHAIITTINNEIFISERMSDILLDYLGNRSVAICQNLTHPTENIVKTDLNNINQYLKHNLNTLVIYPKLF